MRTIVVVGSRCRNRLSSMLTLMTSRASGSPSLTRDTSRRLRGVIAAKLPDLGVVAFTEERSRFLSHPGGHSDGRSTKPTRGRHRFVSVLGADRRDGTARGLVRLRGSRSSRPCRRASPPTCRHPRRAVVERQRPRRARPESFREPTSPRSNLLSFRPWLRPSIPATTTSAARAGSQTRTLVWSTSARGARSSRSTGAGRPAATGCRSSHGDPQSRACELAAGIGPHKMDQTVS